MQKILVVTSTLPSSSSDPVPAFVRDQVVALKKEYPEIEFSILAPHDTRSHTVDFRKHADYDEYRFHYFWPFKLEKLAGRGIMPQLKKNSLYYLMIPFLFAGEFLAVWRLVRTLNPDIVYAHWFTPQGIVIGMVPRRRKIPVVLTTHASDVAVWHKIPFGGMIVRHYARKLDAITAVSRRTLGKLEAFFSEEQWKKDMLPKIKIIPMGVDVAVQGKKDRQTQGQHIAFIGRLAEKKGVQYLLPAFAKITEDYPEATLTIAGDGTMLEELKRQAKQLELSDVQVHFPGFVSGSDKQRVLDEADIYVVPSIVTKSGDAEGLPVSLMEGLAAGKVCIATNESGADDIIEDGKSGYLIPQKDTVALEKALQAALTLSPGTRASLETEARKTAKQFEWPEIARRHYEHLFK